MWVQVITAQTVVFVSLSENKCNRSCKTTLLQISMSDTAGFKTEWKTNHYFISGRSTRSCHCHRSTSHQSASSPSQWPADEAVTALHTLTHPALMGRLLLALTDNLILRATWQTATQLSQERLNYLHGSPLSSLNMSMGVFKLVKQKPLQEIIM